MRRIWFVPVIITALGTSACADDTRLHAFERMLDNDRFYEAATELAAACGAPNDAPPELGCAEHVVNLLTRWEQSTTPPTSAADHVIVARIAVYAQLPETMLWNAARAFVMYQQDRDEAGQWIHRADEIVHTFPKAIADSAHDDLIAAFWARRAYYSGQDSEFRAHHPLTTSIAVAAYEIAAAQGYWDRARVLAEEGKLGEDAYRRARTAELAAEFAEAITGTWYAHFQKALEIAKDPEARITVESIGEAFDAAKAAKAYDEAIAFADILVIPTAERRALAIALFEEEIKRNAFNAFRTALHYDLEQSYVNRARDLAFRQSIERGTFTLARALPDGTFLVIDRR